MELSTRVVTEDAGGISYSANMFQEIFQANKQIKNNITLHEYEIVDQEAIDAQNENCCLTNEVFPKATFITFAALTIPFAITVAILLIVCLTISTTRTVDSKVNLGYNQACIFDEQCSSNLKCVSRRCACDVTEIYNGTSCRSRKSRNEVCTTSGECDFDNKQLICVNSKCDCYTRVQYYDTTNRKCANYLLTDESCRNGGQCNPNTGSTCFTYCGGTAANCKRCT